jgi:hypothetical protein
MRAPYRPMQLALELPPTPKKALWTARRRPDRARAVRPCPPARQAAPPRATASNGTGPDGTDDALEAREVGSELVPGAPHLWVHERRPPRRPAPLPPRKHRVKYGFKLGNEPRMRATHRGIAPHVLR